MPVTCKPAYITLGDRPLCECGDYLMREYRLTCGYRSLASAKRAKQELQKHYRSVRVVPGHCPVSVALLDNKK